MQNIVRRSHIVGIVYVYCRTIKSKQFNTLESTSELY